MLLYERFDVFARFQKICQKANFGVENENMKEKENTKGPRRMGSASGDTTFDSFFSSYKTIIRFALLDEASGKRTSKRSKKKCNIFLDAVEHLFELVYFLP